VRATTEYKLASKTAKALRLTIAAAFLDRADKLIE
jgi:hypothetical protein